MALLLNDIYLSPQKMLLCGLFSRSGSHLTEARAFCTNKEPMLCHYMRKIRSTKPIPTPEISRFQYQLGIVITNTCYCWCLLPPLSREEVVLTTKALERDGR